MDARLIVAGLAFAISQVCAQDFSEGFDHSHALWDRLLKKHVEVLDRGKTSRADYAGFARERAALKGYLAALEKVPEADFRNFSRTQRMAFLINAYNAYTVEKVLTRYPDLRSIRDFGRFFGNPFKDEFFSLFGRRSSLDAIEHGMLRRSYAEPRVHYALNCAAVGCPMLREEAYVPERLEHQLEAQAVRFLSDRSRNRAGETGLEVSRIFDWYGEDFEPRDRYFARYARLLSDDPAVQQRVAERSAPITFLEYDWSLNNSRSSSRR